MRGSVDLSDGAGNFATIDYSGEKPALYTGQQVTLQELGIRGGEMAPTRDTKLSSKKLACPNCNAVLTPPQLKDGWCESCGKPIPHFVHTPSYAGNKKSEHEVNLLVRGPEPHHHPAPAIRTAGPDETPMTAGQKALMALFILACLVVVGSAFMGDERSIGTLVRIGGMFAGVLLLGLIVWAVRTVSGKKA